MTLLPLYSGARERTGESSVARLAGDAEALLTSFATLAPPDGDLPHLLLLSTPEQDEVHLLPTPSNDAEKRRLACVVIPEIVRASGAQVAAHAHHAWALAVSGPSPAGGWPRPSQHPQREEVVILTVLGEGSEYQRLWRVQRIPDAAPTLRRHHEGDNGSDNGGFGLFVHAMRHGLNQYAAARLTGDYTPTPARPLVLGYAFDDERQVGDTEECLPNSLWCPTMRGDGADYRPELYCPVVSTEQEGAARRVLSTTGEEVPVSGELAERTLTWGAITLPLLAVRDFDALRWLRGELAELPPLSAEPAPAPRAQRVGRNDPCPCGAAHADGRPMKYKRCCNV